ncbi:laccase domain-containing protein 1-like [Gymnodraco acuticeps]|uniref:Laccase domain-containing protein 1-like n=1 Tax=Gymnodraco acuticeps TaxID=8218 RepID=A0A6P8V0Z9_GYMAC|nr:laccase domain-containing protein 1-like [Gymnodraco acuticeps]XP_034083112.1 laccase domain-containing protein 1-like [Gymnodraco acuticeps]XP_034083113.1 laccase domain-containing protein 1-like [Gymnodraco acuticeps]
MEAVLLALLPGCSASCLGLSPSLSRPALVLQLDSGSTTETLFRFKLTADQLGISTVRVHTTARGRDVLRRYQQLLFTSLYTFDYQVHYVTCCTDHAHKRSPGGKEVEEEVSGFLQQLPAQRGCVQVLKSPLIPECFGHGFSTRAGGVSSIASLSSLNLFSSSRRRDSLSVVQENRRRLALKAGFNPRDLQLVKVDHGSAVWVVGGAEPERYDAMVTDQRGRVLAAPGSDCMPLLFADQGSKVIGAAHAGWKGTLEGVAMATVGAMVTEFGCRARDIVVAVGPSVGGCCFTLDRKQALHFLLLHPDCVKDPEAERPHVNIRLANRILLERGGVLPGNIDDSSVSECTSCHTELFFSHVRDGLNFGTQLGFLWIREEEEGEEEEEGRERETDR